MFSNTAIFALKSLGSVTWKKTPQCPSSSFLCLLLSTPHPFFYGEVSNIKLFNTHTSVSLIQLLNSNMSSTVNNKWVNGCIRQLKLKWGNIQSNNSHICNHCHTKLHTGESPGFCCRKNRKYANEPPPLLSPTRGTRLKADFTRCLQTSFGQWPSPLFRRERRGIRIDGIDVPRTGDSTWSLRDFKW